MHLEHVRVENDDRIVIPATANRYLRLVPGETLVVDFDAVSLLIRRLKPGRR